MAWLRYYALYAVLIAPFLAVDEWVIAPRSHPGSYAALAVEILACMTAARRLERRWWPRG